MIALYDENKRVSYYPQTVFPFTWLLNYVTGSSQWVDLENLSGSWTNHSDYFTENIGSTDLFKIFVSKEQFSHKVARRVICQLWLSSIFQYYTVKYS